MSEHRVECVRSLSAQLDPDMVLYLVQQPPCFPSGCKDRIRYPPSLCEVGKYYSPIHALYHIRLRLCQIALRLTGITRD